MTKSEIINLMQALSNIKGAKEELAYYKKEGYLRDTGALEYVKRAEEALSKCLKKK